MSATATVQMCLGRRSTGQTLNGDSNSYRLSATAIPSDLQHHNSSALILVTNHPAPHTGHVRILQLNRPSARNAISNALLISLNSEISKINSQYDAATHEEVSCNLSLDNFGPTRAVIIASTDERSFCSGADLKERKTFSAAETAAFLSLLRSSLTALENLAIPVIAAVSGPALGGGFELALAAHLRVMSPAAELALPETRLAIIPGAGGMRRLAALVGTTRARELVLTGRRLNGAGALRLGVADRLVKTCAANKSWSESVLEEAIALARDICHGGPIAVRMTMRVFKELNEESENAAYERVLNTEDRDAALLAFAEKRQPVFHGR